MVECAGGGEVADRGVVLLAPVVGPLSAGDFVRTACRRGFGPPFTLVLLFPPRNLQGFRVFYFPDIIENMKVMMYSQNDLRFMQRAVELAMRGEGWVNPNPLVGAVIVRNGRIIGAGWHERWGSLHAERNALARCSESPSGATLYVTLEPCCHHGKQPPCVDAIIDSGISRVVVGHEDPNPLVAGKGIARMREAGISVTCGVMEQELRHMNRVFIKYITTQRPWIVMKSAMTLDGKIATATGDSRWVTGPSALAEVHRMRHRNMAILAGIGTVAADDPMLNCRFEGREVRQPVRIVADSSARISPDSQIVHTAGSYRTIVAHTETAPAPRVELLRKAGVETWCCRRRDDELDIDDLVRRIGEAGIDSVLLEGGGTLNEAFLRSRNIDEVCAFIAPKLIGGAEAKTPVEGRGIERMADAVRLENIRTASFDGDIMISGIVTRN